MTTALLQPDELKPQIIIIDEPELGLHPYAVSLLAAMIKATSKTKQVIISTQSVDLLNEFEPEDVIVADMKNNKSELSRLNSEQLKSWLEDYTLGELWKKNAFGGRPSK